jgi:hypothetical protein
VLDNAWTKGERKLCRVSHGTSLYFEFSFLWVWACTNPKMKLRQFGFSYQVLNFMTKVIFSISFMFIVLCAEHYFVFYLNSGFHIKRRKKVSFVQVKTAIP